jgi:hypothetical protein
MKPEAEPEEAEMEVLKLKLKSKTRIGLQQRRSLDNGSKAEICYSARKRINRFLPDGSAADLCPIWVLFFSEFQHCKPSQSPHLFLRETLKSLP